MAAVGQVVCDGSGDGVDVTLLLLETRADLCLDVQWHDLAEEATRALLSNACHRRNSRSMRAATPAMQADRPLRRTRRS